MTTETKPHPADALPLPELENIGDPSCYGYSEYGVRAYGRQCYELAMRKAQEGREPVARVELMTTGGNVGIATRIVEIDDQLRERLSPGALLYTSPPPKSDEAMDAERLEIANEALRSIDAIALRCIGEPVTTIEEELMRISTKCHAALAAQQKGGEV